MPNKNLPDLPDDVTTKLFRVVESRLKGNPLLRATVKTWQTWEGVPDDKTPPGSAAQPWVCITPRAESEHWWSAETQIGQLVIQIETRTRGTCVDDMLNLWGLIRSALSPLAGTPDSYSLVQQLQAAGAHKGLIEMSQPLFDYSGDAGQDGAFRGVGSVRLDYRARAAS